MALVVVVAAAVVSRDRIKCNKDSSFEMQLNATAAAKPHETQLVKLHAQRTFVSVSVSVSVLVSA